MIKAKIVMKAVNILAEKEDRNTDYQCSEPTDICRKESTKYEFTLETDLPKGWGKRHLQTLLGSVTVCIAFVIKTNIGIAIIAMTTPNYNNNTEIFDWDKKTRNMVTSSFFFGYLLMMIPFGIIAQKYGGKKPIVVCFGFCSLLSILFPIVTKVGGWGTACAFRFLQGLTMSAVLPCIHNMVGKWSPLLERGRATSYIYTGSQIGKGLTMAISGYLCASAIGWPLIFYVSGLCTFVGGLMMWWLGADSPSHHSTISKVEYDYIKKTSGGNAGQKKLKTPWMMQLRNFPFWVAIITQSGYIWNLNTIMFEVPAYMNSILGVNIKNNGLLNAAPYIVTCILAIVISNILDYLLKRRTFTITTARKISNTIGMWLSGALLLAFCFTPANQLSLATFLLISSIGTMAGINSGYIVTLTDIAPNFSGNTMSTGAALGNLVAAIGSLLNGLIIVDVNDVSQWRTVIGLSVGVMFVANLIFIIFATSKVQSWNSGKDAPRTNGEL